MRIIKDTACNIYRAIAGEMLNIELSCLYFINGRIINASERTIGYPRIEHDGKLDIFRAVSGYIYIPVGTDIEVFESGLICELAALENELRGASLLTNSPHTIETGYHTNVVTVSGDTNTVALCNNRSRYPAPHHSFTVCKRLFTCNPSLCQYNAKFAWVIRYIDQFNFEITSRSIEDSISRYVSSVFYDGDDICTLSHNTITFEFSTDMLVGSKHITPETVNIFAHGDPLLIELSEYWKYAVPSPHANAFLRNVPLRDVYESDLDDFYLHILDPYDGPEPTSGAHRCTVCRSILWGDNYILDEPVSDSYNTTAICALCLHSSSMIRPIECKFSKLYRVTFPFVLNDMVNIQHIAPRRQDLLREMSKGVNIVDIDAGTSTYECALIGDRYIAFENVNSYLYTRLMRKLACWNRIVCTMILIR